MSMQSAMVNVLLKEVQGVRGETLHPVTSQADNHYFMPGNLVMKKQISILDPSFKSAKFGLNHILKLPVDLPWENERILMEKVSSKQTEDVSALVGLSVKNSYVVSNAKILSNEFGISVSGKDKVEFNFTDLNLEKIELDRQELCSLLADSRVNMNHGLITQAQRYMKKRKYFVFERKKVLCLVMSCVRAANDVSIVTKIIKSVSQEVKDNVDTIGPDIDLNETVRRDNNTCKSATIKKGTVLAYEMRELRVDYYGRIELQVSLDGRGRLDRFPGRRAQLQDQDLEIDCLEDPLIEKKKAEVVLDTALSSIQLATDDEKRDIQEAILTSIDTDADPRRAIVSVLHQEEVESLDDSDEYMDLDLDSDSIPMRKLSKFIRRKKKSSIGGASNQSLDEQRVSGLMVVSEALSCIPPDVTKLLIGQDRHQSDVKAMLQQLRDTGSSTTGSPEAASIGAQLGCKVSEAAPDGQVQVQVVGAEVRSKVTSAFIITHCLATGQKKEILDEIEAATDEDSKMGIAAVDSTKMGISVVDSTKMGISVVDSTKMSVAAADIKSMGTSEAAVQKGTHLPMTKQNQA